MLTIIDTITDFCGKLAAWLFFAIGGIIVYEVVARYVFVAPTVWGEEMSRFLQIWATYLAAAFVLRHRQLIAIDVVVQKMAPKPRLICESAALLVVALFCLVAVYYGMATVIDSIRLGRATSSMIAVPNWMTEAAIPLGFGLMLLQSLAELIRTVSGTASSGADSH